jgi:hypothetical protein
MAKVDFGEYSAFTTKNSVRYQKNSKLVSEAAVPPEVVAYLNKQLNYSKPEPKFPMPTEEEKARLRAESLQVKPELQGENTTVTEEQLLQPVVEPLTDEDFNDNFDPTTVSSQPGGVYDPSVLDPATYIDPSEKGLAPELGIVSETPVPAFDPDFLEQVSIHTASLFDIANVLSERFGIYTVYLGRLPVQDEVNPLTGELFSKYHLGIAYQAAIRAQHSGVLTVAPEVMRRNIDESRTASENFQVDQAPQTMGEARRANSFDFRTSVQGNQPVANTEIVHEVQPDGSVRAVQRPIEQGSVGSVNGAQSRYDAEEDEPLVQPNFSGKPIIRPNW